MFMYGSTEDTEDVLDIEDVESVTYLILQAADVSDSH